MNFEQLYLQAGATAVIAMLFTFVIRWLLKHVDCLVKTNKETSLAFSETMNDHLNENTKALAELMVLVKNLNGRLQRGG